jgi:LacI family transcriptional regulator
MSLAAPTGMLGLLLDTSCDDFYSRLLDGVQKAAGQAGFDLWISIVRPSDSPKEFLTSLGAQGTDGLLAFATSLREEGLAFCHQRGFPMVLIHQSPPRGMEIPWVTVECKESSRAIVAHLIEAHGRRRIVFLRGPEGQEDSNSREAGYRQALEDHGIAFDPVLIAQGDFNRDVAESSIKNLLATGLEMNAIFSGNDEAAVGALKALREAGRKVPEDVAVVGFDDLPLTAYLIPPLTTIHAPTEEVGYEAGRQLIQLIQTGHTEQRTVLPTHLIIRRSCGCKS